MSNEHNDGGQAFPRPAVFSPTTGRTICVELDGMSLRDYAAIHFIAAWIPALVKRNDTYDEAVAEAQTLGSYQVDLFIRMREGK